MSEVFQKMMEELEKKFKIQEIQCETIQDFLDGVFKNGNPRGVIRVSQGFCERVYLFLDHKIQGIEIPPHVLNKDVVESYEIVHTLEDITEYYFRIKEEETETHTIILFDVKGGKD